MSDTSLPVRDWSCSYYDATTKRWLSGIFRLFLSRLNFIPKCVGRATPISLPFHAIRAVEKETTTLIFGAITIKLRDGVKHWFSSFESRESTFFVVVHFWKNYSLLKGENSIDAIVTRPGELAALIVDAQKTLEGAASELHSQGRQLDQASRMMNDIHSDLDVVEGILKDMGSWLDTWKAADELVHYVKNQRKSKKKGDFDGKFPVLFDIKLKSVHRPGHLVFRSGRRNNLIIYDERQKEMFQIEADAKLSLTAHTPYHFTLTNNNAPRGSNAAISIISVVAIAIIEDITKTFRTEIEYDTPPEAADDPELEQESDYDTKPSVGELPLLSWTEAAESEWTNEAPRLEHHTSGHHQMQAQAVMRKQARDEELNLVSQGLEKMRQLATNLGEETDMQLELLDQLDVSTDKATQRMKEASKRTRDLAK